ncbi:TackOD1 domain-containing metal-binding protein [Desulfolithobacter sp.]
MRTAVFIPSSNMPRPPVDIPVADIDSLSSVDDEKVAFFLIDCSDPDTAYQQLCRIRRMLDPALYLRPVLFLPGPESVQKNILQSADGTLQAVGHSLHEQLESWTAKLEGINKKINQYTGQPKQNDTNIAFKVLRFIASRNLKAEPIPSVQSLSGYIFPALQPLFPKPDNGIFETLEYLETQRLLSGSFISSAYSCTHCGCAFLNFYEICTDCGSSDLVTDELIHHFKCAFVGELSEYRHGNELICPKCDKTLHHIGVDYDKTSIVYHCNQCGNVFQEASVMTSCYNCHRETEPENQVQRPIKSYTITAIGENAASYGMDSLFQNILVSKVPTLAFSTFKEFFRIEQARIQRYGVTVSSLAALRLGGIEELYTRLGKRSREIFDEISDAFKTTLRSSDLFTMRNETLFLIILTETTPENGERALKRIEKRIGRLLKSNLDITLDSDFAIWQITPDLDPDTCLEKILSQYAT